MKYFKKTISLPIKAGAGNLVGKVGTIAKPEHIKALQDHWKKHNVADETEKYITDDPQIYYEIQSERLLNVLFRQSGGVGAGATKEHRFQRLEATVKTFYQIVEVWGDRERATEYIRKRFASLRNGSFSNLINHIKDYENSIEENAEHQSES